MMRRFDRVLLFIMFTVCALVSSGCAKRGINSGGSAPLPAPSGALGLDFDHPQHGDWPEASSVQEAQNDVAFSIVVPSKLASPQIFETPLDLPSKERAVILVYHDSTYGRFWIREELPDYESDKERLDYYQSRVDSNGSKDKNVSDQIVKLDNKQPALVATSINYGIATITWVVDGVQFTVIGEQTSPDDAVAIANSV